MLIGGSKLADTLMPAKTLLIGIWCLTETYWAAAWMAAVMSAMATEFSPGVMGYWMVMV